MEFVLTAVAWVRGGRMNPHDDGWRNVRARIELAPDLADEALHGLDAFSHAEVSFIFHRLSADDVICDARHPHDRRDWPRVGVFAQRARNRPNRLGVSICRILSVDGRGFEVEGLDAIDGSPVVDIKPVISGFLPRSPVREPDWAREIMKDYW